jgi:hypothetical protein
MLPFANLRHCVVCQASTAPCLCKGQVFGRVPTLAAVHPISYVSFRHAASQFNGCLGLTVQRSSV